jgi:hypothetical protein
MIESSDGHGLIGSPDGGQLVLLVGPAYQRMIQTAADAGIPMQDARYVRDHAALKAMAATSGRTEVLLASVSEVEGILDRSAFGPYTELAYLADRVIYGGMQDDVPVWPLEAGLGLEVRGGVASLHRVTQTQYA